MNFTKFNAEVFDAWADLDQDLTDFYLIVRNGEYVLTNRDTSGAKLVGRFSKLKRTPDHKWVPLSITEFRLAVEAAMTELRPA